MMEYANRLSRKVIALVLAGALCSCGLMMCSSKVPFHADGPQRDLTSYHTYAWPERNRFDAETRSWAPDAVLDKVVRLAIDQEMGAFKFVLKDSAADLEIEYHIASMEDVALMKSNSTDHRISWSNRQTGALPPRDGMIFISLTDSKTLKFVWWGFMNQDPGSQSGDFTEADTRRAIQKLFLKYPPRNK